MSLCKENKVEKCTSSTIKFNNQLLNPLNLNLISKWSDTNNLRIYDGLFFCSIPIAICMENTFARAFLLLAKANPDSKLCL